MEFVGYHTCEDRDEFDRTVESAPFRSEPTSNPFLGLGYYFWEYHLDMAHGWGNLWYKEKYLIFKAEITENGDILDLTAPEFQDYFMKMLDDFEFMRDWPIGRVIDELRVLNKKPQYAGIFDFNMARAVNERKNIKNLILKKFANNNPALTSFFRGTHILCIFEKGKKNISTFVCVYPNEYKES